MIQKFVIGYLARVLSAGTTFATVEPGTYTMCKVDSLGNQSAQMAIAVS
ncbi:MAG: hypothetical protein KME46_04550 [Brasilonema angustatum HA4187-MV1]|jgi:hypothetical protein|nr:hypothetical protein [Brasilonema angustatum HA4187-MV1]